MLQQVGTLLGRQTIGHRSMYSGRSFAAGSTAGHRLSSIVVVNRHHRQSSRRLRLGWRVSSISTAAAGLRARSEQRHKTGKLKTDCSFAVRQRLDAPKPCASTSLERGPAAARRARGAGPRGRWARSTEECATRFPAHSSVVCVHRPTAGFASRASPPRPPNRRPPAPRASVFFVSYGLFFAFVCGIR